MSAHTEPNNSLADTPLVSVTEQQAADLNDLIALDYDALGAYEAAVERVDNIELKDKLDQFKADQQRHIDEWSSLVSGSGFSPATSGDARRLLERGRVVIAKIAGDRGVLRAIRSNEQTTKRKYEDALANEHFRDRPDVKLRMVRNLGDQRLHRMWLGL